MTIALDGTPVTKTFSGAATGASPAFSTTQTNDILVLAFSCEKSSVRSQISTITDTAGLTWQRRKQLLFNASNTELQTIEIWWAVAAAALTNNVITVTLDVATDDACFAVWAVHGVGNTAAPWATDAGAPYSNSDITGSNTTPTVSGVTLNADSKNLFIFAVEAHGSSPSAPTPYGTSIAAINNNGGANFDHLSVGYATGTVSADTFSTQTGSINNWGMVVDALVSADAPVAANARVSGVAVEALTPGISNMRLSGVSLEVLHSFVRVTGTAWNPSDASTNIVLSNSNLTAAQNTTAQGGVRGVDKKAAGKYYVEVDSTGWSGNDAVGGNGFGIANSAALLASIGSNTALNAAIINSQSTGLNRINLQINGTTQTNFPPPGPVDMAVDLNNKLIWFRINGGNWNENSAADPGKATGGYDISGMVSDGVFLVACLKGQIATMTLRSGGNMQRGVPTGFTAGWPVAAPGDPTRVTQTYGEILRSSLDRKSPGILLAHKRMLPPPASFFPTLTGSNSELPTLTDTTDHGLRFAFGSSPAAGDNVRCALRAKPNATDYSIIARLQGSNLFWNFDLWGICVSDGTKIVTFGVTGAAGNGFRFSVDKWNSATSWNSSAISSTATPGREDCEWFKLDIIGGAPTDFSISHNGLDWVKIYSGSVASFLTYTQIGFGADVNRNGGLIPVASTPHLFVDCLYWSDPQLFPGV